MPYSLTRLLEDVHYSCSTMTCMSTSKEFKGAEFFPYKKRFASHPQRGLSSYLFFSLETTILDLS